MDESPRRWLILLCAIFLSLITVFAQVDELKLPYLRGQQVLRHDKIIEGVTPTYAQYRILSDILVEGVIRAFTAVGIPEPVLSGFISFRVFQNTLIFVLAALYYRRLGLNTYVILVGLSLLAWGMTHALYNSDLAFNTYSEVIFYLAAPLVIMSGRYFWIIPITAFAAVNRETCGLIPVMLLVYDAWQRQTWPAKKTMVIAAVSLVLFAAAFIGLRLIFGVAPGIIPDNEVYGAKAGISSLIHNLTSWRVHANFFLVVGILPFLALFSYRHWPPALRAFAWGFLPIWTAIHIYLSPLDESRYFMFPLVLFFVPGTLFGLVASIKGFALSQRSEVPQFE